MDFFEAVRNRHSYRGTFLPAAVPREHLERILDAGIRAPSGGNQQTTSFIAVTDGALRAAVADIMPKKTTQTAPVIIAVVTERREVYGMTFELEDYAAATENMLLAIAALGYAGVWIDGHLKSEDRAARIGALLGVPAGGTVRAVLPFGVPAQPGAQAERLPFGRRARIL